VEWNAKEKMPESSNKVPEITAAFWIIKIAATTLGETGGDTVTMTLNWGYLAGTALFLAALVLLVSLQIIAKKFHTFLYIGRRSLPPPPSAQPWRILPIARWASATPALVNFVVLFVGYSWPLVLVAWLDFGRHRRHAKGGGVLLGCHHFFADLGNCVG